MPARIPPGMLALATPATQNTKLGEAATTYAAQLSCPTGCVFRDGGGCYAETGRLGKFVTTPLNAAAGNPLPVEVATAEAAAIDALPSRGVDGSALPLRLHTVGDCPTDECARIVAAACERFVARGGGPVWTYTHAWKQVARSSWGLVSVFASCETVTDVIEARVRGYATALVVDRFPSRRLYREGSAVLPCPAQTSHRTCTSCRLCWDDHAVRERGYSIGFEVHGVPLAQRQARMALADPGDPARRVPSEKRVGRARRQLLRELGREPTIRETMARLGDGLNYASVGEWLRFHRGEIIHPSERRRHQRAARRRAA